MLNYLCIRCGISNINTWYKMTHGWLLCLSCLPLSKSWCVSWLTLSSTWIQLFLLAKWLLPVAVVTHLPFSLGGKGKREVKGTRELKWEFWERGGVTAICCVWGKEKNVCVLNWQDVVPLDCLLLMSLAGGNPSIPDDCSPLVTYFFSCCFHYIDFVWILSNIFCFLLGPRGVCEEDGAKILSSAQQKNKRQLSQLQQGNFQPPQGRLSGRGA